MIFLTWQSRVPSTHTITILAAILSACTQKLRSMYRPLMAQRSDAAPLRTGLLSGSTLKPVPFSPFFLSVLLHLQSLSLSLPPFLSQRLSLTAPPCPWLGYVSQSWGKGVRISAAALPCTPAHVLSLRARQRGRERWREKQGSCWWCRQKQCLHQLKVGKLY